MTMNEWCGWLIMRASNDPHTFFMSLCWNIFGYLDSYSVTCYSDTHFKITQHSFFFSSSWESQTIRFFKDSKREQSQCAMILSINRVNWAKWTLKKEATCSEKRMEEKTVCTWHYIHNEVTVSRNEQQTALSLWAGVFQTQDAMYGFSVCGFIRI